MCFLCASFLSIDTSNIEFGIFLKIKKLFSQPDLILPTRPTKNNKSGKWKPIPIADNFKEHF